MNDKCYFLRYTKSELLFVLMFVLILPQSILSSYLSESFSYTDELFAMIGLFSFVSCYSRKSVWKYNAKLKCIFFSLLLIVSIGWLSTIRYQIQDYFYINLSDCFSLIKMFLILFLTLRLLCKSDLTKLIQVVFYIVRFYIVIGGILCALNQFVDIGMTEEYRFGLRNFRFIHSNSGDYASILVVVLSILHVYASICKKGHYLLKFLVIFCLAFTLRGKAMGMIITYIFLIMFIKYFNNLSFKSLFVLSAVGVAGAFFQIRFYFIDNVTARSLFLLNGLGTANKYFPLGAGFSTYGSNMAKVHYSFLYTEYGFPSVYGMSEEEPQFLNDNFWPMILGQFGWISFAAYLFILFTIFRIVSENIANRELKIAGFILFFLFAYSSVGGPIFVHYIGCAGIIIFSLMIALANKKQLSYV